MVYKTPPSSSPDDDALRVLGTVLSSGRSSRFYENIVRQKQLAPNVSAFGGESRGPNLFSIVGTVNPGKSVADLEAAIEAEIERVKTGPIEDWEIEKARNNARNQLVNSLGSALDRAVTLGEDALFYNNPDRINTRADSIAKVTGGRRAARREAVPRQDRPNGGDHGAQGRAARKEACDADRCARARCSRLPCVSSSASSRRPPVRRRRAARRSRPRAPGWSSRARRRSRTTS